MRDPELRRGVLAESSEGESLHSLKRAVAFHRSGEIRDRSFEAQGNGASGPNLVAMAISVSVWNTAYLGRVVEAVYAEGKTVPNELSDHDSLLGWEFIGLTGDCL